MFGQLMPVGDHSKSHVSSLMSSDLRPGGMQRVAGICNLTDAGLKFFSSNKNKVAKHWGIGEITAPRLQSHELSFPVQLGIDVGVAPFFSPMGYIDVNLFEKIFFLKIEMGALMFHRLRSEHEVEDEPIPVFYGSLGLNHSLIRIDKSRVYAHLALGTVGFFGFGPVGTLKYLYKFSDMFAVSASVEQNVCGQR
jgi:hypothetical protein